MLGALMSLALLILSIIRLDGFALLATILLSLLSTLIGIGSRWSLSLGKRKADRHLPKDNIIIKYPHGAFLVVKCDENIARELYWHPEECNYTFGDTTYRIISLVGTIMLMFGVICLGNSTLPLQTAFAAAYMILNAVYWTVAALPAQWHWDLSCYQVEREDYAGGESHDSFTHALWKAIAISQSTQWVRHGQVAPISEAWKSWVDTAESIVYKEKERLEAEGRISDWVEGEKGKVRALPTWNAEQALTELLNPDEATKSV